MESFNEDEEVVVCWRCGTLLEVEFLDTTLWDRELECCALCKEEIERNQRRGQNQ